MTPASTKRFSGQFLVFRKLPKGQLSKRAGGNKLPRFKHPTFESAETEARRLLVLYPESTFIIMQEVGLIRNQTATAEQETADA